MGKKHNIEQIAPVKAKPQARLRTDAIPPRIARMPSIENGIKYAAMTENGMVDDDPSEKAFAIAQMNHEPNTVLTTQIAPETIINMPLVLDFPDLVPILAEFCI